MLQLDLRLFWLGPRAPYVARFIQLSQHINRVACFLLFFFLLFILETEEGKY